jgi:hypothetical protein
LVLIVNPELDVKNVQELIALAKAKPGQLSYASSGVGSVHHLAGELFKFKAGISIVHVPYKGAGPALTDLIGGQVPMMFATIGEVKANISALEKSILSMLIAGEDASSIASATGASVEEIAKSTERLIDFELLVEGEVSDLGKQLLDEAPAPIDQFMVVYTYKERPGVPRVLTKSRDFCLRLLSLNRLYTRDEINNISSRVDRNVWNYRGGWYTNPQTQVSTPFCRHIWVQQLVIKKQ